jgi:hypothetical protein
MRAFAFSYFLAEDCSEGANYFRCAKPPGMETLYLNKTDLTVACLTTGRNYVGLLSAYGRCRIAST